MELQDPLRALKADLSSVNEILHLSPVIAREQFVLRCRPGGQPDDCRTQTLSESLPLPVGQPMVAIHTQWFSSSVVGQDSPCAEKTCVYAKETLLPNSFMLFPQLTNDS